MSSLGSIFVIAEPAREDLKRRVHRAAPQQTAPEIENRVCCLEYALQSCFQEKPADDQEVQACGIGDELLEIFEEFILDTRAYAEYCATFRGFLNYKPPGSVTAPMTGEPVSDWMASQLEIQGDPITIDSVSKRLPGRPASYRLQTDDRDELVQRICARKQWRPTLVRIWVGEMERFLAIKAFMDDSDASKVSPSGYVDAMWHELILDTRMYNSHCHALLGKFIHHNPDGTMEHNRAGRYGCTLACYRQLFKREPCSIAWETEEEAASRG
eukprot:jgi/Ulvmu1/5262/UM022_0056.1